MAAGLPAEGCCNGTAVAAVDRLAGSLMPYDADEMVH